MSSQNTLVSALSSISHQLESNFQAVNSLSMSIVSYALKLGYATYASDPNYPFWTVTYLNKIFINSMKGVTLATTKVPIWLADIINLLKPKTVEFDAGEVSYTWNLDFDEFSTIWTTDLTPGGSNRTINFGIVSNTSYINGVIPEIVSPGSYTEENGQTAFSSFLAFFASKDHELVPLVNPADHQRYSKDPSCFSSTKVISGSAYALQNGPMKTVSLEIPVRTPVAACMSKLDTPSGPQTGRSPNHTLYYGGDPFWFAGLKASKISNKLFKSKLTPAFANIDFNRILDVVAQYATQLAQIASNDIQYTNYLLSNIGYFDCPLTLQEIGLMLRNELMNAFGDTQFMVQGMYPLAPGSNGNPFVPFVHGMGTFGSTATGMLLPQTLCENIRSLTWRVCGKRPMIYAPVLGQYVEDELTTDFYRYQPNDGDFRDVFKSPDALYSFEVDSKGGKVKKVMAETPISYIDGSSSGRFYDINHPSAISKYIRAWNQWIELLKPFSVNLSTISADGGLLLLNMISKNQIVAPLELSRPLADPSKRCAHHADLRFPKDQKYGASLYDARAMLAVVSKEPFLQQPFQLVQNLWIGPESIINLGNTIENTATIQKIQGYYHEPWSTVMTDNEDNVSISTLHRQYVSTMVGARNSVPTQQSLLFTEWEAQGRGGILSSLLTGLASIIPV